MTISTLRIRLPGICVAVGLASGAYAASGLPAKLESQTKVAFANIAKAKAALNAGKTTTSESYLAKSEGLLKNVLAAAPGAPASSGSPAQRGTSTASRAENELAKVDPSLAAKVGVREQQSSANGDADAGTPAQTAPEANATHPQSVIEKIQSTYEKVSLARTLLQGGNASKAKSLLDQIPSSPLGILKGASRL
jgi:hypothetical protein